MKLRDQMPELEGETKWFNSNPIQKSDLIGNRPTLIHFWSVSCGLCKEAMPNVNKLRDDYKNDLNVIAVHKPRTKKDLDLDQMKEVADEHNITQPIFVDNGRKLSDAFDNKYVPAYYVFDEEGKLRHFQTGDGGMKMLRKRVDRLLGNTY
ncbi:TlpA disulfide reductase family protein [Lentibacillus sp. N15]|uniref:TlpA family protein disulfide reductase n=1 Tax=Lentibacillus songyuanensis TaxID=3136161 RepID=UPI0031B9D1C2